MTYMAETQALDLKAENERLRALNTELVKALKLAERGLGIHAFETHVDDPNCRTCAKCGKYMTHRHHARAEDGHPLDVMADAQRKSAAALAKAEQANAD